jgi:hypothetical protein
VGDSSAMRGDSASFVCRSSDGKKSPLGREDTCIVQTLGKLLQQLGWTPSEPAIVLVLISALRAMHGALALFDGK